MEMAIICSHSISYTTSQHQKAHAMAKTSVDLPALDGDLFLPVPVVLLAELVSEAMELGQAYQEILRAIEGTRTGSAWRRSSCGASTPIGGCARRLFCRERTVSPSARWSCRRSRAGTRACLPRRFSPS
jgi:hypothetical protein